MNKLQKALIGTTIVGSVLGGGAFGATLIGAASAETDTPTGTATSGAATSGSGDSSSTTAPGTSESGTTGAPTGDAPRHDPAKGGHVGENGTVETLLTGDTADKVTQAVLAAYPDASIQRVETDAEGAAYEAHIVKSDGSPATVKLDESFAVTSTETGR